MTGLLIRGGTVIDGLGGTARVEDVRVREGRIVELGPRLSVDGERELDASAAIVAPGFVDAHTHLDPWLWSDPSFAPLPQHGVTTAVIGNCSLSLAPVGDDHDALMDMFGYIEDVPAEVLDRAAPWGWRTWSEYVAQAGAVRSICFRALEMGAFVALPISFFEEQLSQGRRDYAYPIALEDARAPCGLERGNAPAEDRLVRPHPRR